MRFGVFHFPTDYSVDIVTLAKALEERGLGSLYVCEHTHIPTSRRSAFPGGGDLPKRYMHSYDPFVSLSFAAAATKNLQFGTGIVLVPQHHHINLAKSISTFDRLSGGRFTFGIGGGWNVEEMEHHGATYETRFAIMKERVLAMKELWTKEVAEFKGKHVQMEPSWQYPKPVQRPHPPVILGGETDYTLKRVVEYCDGWLPRAKPGWEPKAQMARLHTMAEKAGRDPKSFKVTVFRAPTDKAGIEACREAGINELLYDAPDVSRDEMMKILDGYAKLMA